MTQTVFSQLIVWQHVTFTVRTPQMRVKAQLAPPRPSTSLPSSEGEERLWRARTSTSRSVSNMYVSLPFRNGRRTGAEAPVRIRWWFGLELGDDADGVVAVDRLAA